MGRIGGGRDYVCHTTTGYQRAGGSEMRHPLRITKSPDSQNGNLVKIDRVQNEGSEC
jgi:hypothetical protein